MALFWHNHFATAYSKLAGTFGAVQGTKMMALKEGELPGPRGQIETVPRVRARQLPRSADRGGAGSGDARLAGRPHQHAAAAAGELRPRDHGALHASASATTSRRTSTRRRACSPAGTCASWRPRRGRRELLRVPVHPQQPRHDRQDVHVPDLRATARRRFRRARPPTACRTASTSSPRWPRIPPRRSASRAGCGTSSSARRSDPDPDFVAAPPASTSPTRRASSRSCATCCSRGGSRIPANWFSRYSWPVEFAVRAVKEVGFTGFSVDNMRAPLIGDGPDAVRAARRQRLGAGPGLVLHRRDAGAHELRVHRSRPISASTSRRPPPAPRTRPTTFVDFFLGSTVGGAVRRRAARRRSRPTCGRRRVDRIDGAAADESRRAVAAHRRLGRIPVGVEESAQHGHFASPLAPHLHPWRRVGVHASACGAGVPADIARAQGARARNLVVVYLSGGNDCAEHRGALPGSLLLQPPADDCRAGRAGAADRHRRERHGARTAPAPRRACARSSTPGAWRSFSAPATRTPAGRTSRASTSGAPADPALQR